MTNYAVFRDGHIEEILSYAQLSKDILEFDTKSGKYRKISLTFLNTVKADMTLNFSFDSYADIYVKRIYQKLTPDEPTAFFCTWTSTDVVEIHLESDTVRYRYQFDFGSTTTVGYVEASKDCTDNDIRLAILSNLGTLHYYKESED